MQHIHTTGDGHPYVIVAHLDRALSVGLVERPMMLDGPLVWAAAMVQTAAGRRPAPITREHAPDLELPLARWTCGTVWGWCTSQATLDVAAYTALEVRRKPATQAMARYTTSANHHAALGPHKARDSTVATTWVRSATWSALVTDPDELATLLAQITHLGARRGLGHGHVTRWTITPGGPATGWQHRPLPGPGAPPRAYRPPYHHPTRQVPGC